MYHWAWPIPFPLVMLIFLYFTGVSVYISTLTLTIIALDRFVVILYPLRTRMQMKTCTVLIAVINLLAMLFTAPYIIFVDVFHSDDGSTG